MELIYKDITYKAHKFNSLNDYMFAEIIAIYNDKWVFSKHKKRDTWETQGGYIEMGETPLEAAKRELFEETGATLFDIEPLCDYWASAKISGTLHTGHGQVYFATIHAFGEIPPDSEMEKIYITDSIPNEQTYPEYMNKIFPLALHHHRTRST